MTASRYPLVSVVIPTYGRPSLLKRAIDSVLAQSYANLEVLVVDDNGLGSRFGMESESLLQGYADDARIRYIQHSSNRNGAAARNTGIKHASGSLISFLDDDDVYLPTKTESQVGELARTTSVQAVSCGWVRDGRCQIPKRPRSMARALMMLEYQPITSTLMFRREVLEALGGFDETFQRHQDVELMLRFSQHYDISIVDECLVGLGSNGGENAVHGRELESLKAQFLSQFSAVLAGLDLDEPGLSGRVIARHYTIAFLDHLHRLHLLLAFKALMRALVASPSECASQIHASSQTFLRRRLGRHVSHAEGER